MAIFKWFRKHSTSSGFGFRSTAEQVTEGVDGSSLTAIVTGPANLLLAYSGSICCWPTVALLRLYWNFDSLLVRGHQWNREGDGQSSGSPWCEGRHSGEENWQWFYGEEKYSGTESRCQDWCYGNGFDISQIREIFRSYLSIIKPTSQYTHVMTE